MTYVLCVDENDKILNVMDKLTVHRIGALHRAFSIFIFNEYNPNQLLLQKRALTKYHTPGLWTNTCCSHPLEYPSIKEQAKTRLLEEMGFSTELTFIDTFCYKSHLKNNLIEHELDHLFIGSTQLNFFSPNQKEIADWRGASIDEIFEEFTLYSNCFTPWFPQALEIILAHISQKKGHL